MTGQETFDGSLLDSSHKEISVNDSDVTSDNDIDESSAVGDAANTSTSSVKTSPKQSVFLCDQCDFRAVLKGSLTRHQKHKHSNIYSHKCSICHIVFETEEAFNSHNTRAHSSLNVCLTCDKIFSRKSALNLHMKSHTGEYNFKCEICSRTFISKNVFEGHVNRHMDIRPHRCTKCGKSFNYKSSCKRHIESCSKPRPPPELKCNLCQEVFSRADSLTAHTAAQHQNMRYFCFECGNAYRYRSSLDKHRRKQKHEAWRS